MKHEWRRLLQAEKEGTLDTERRQLASNDWSTDHGDEATGTRQRDHGL